MQNSKYRKLKTIWNNKLFSKNLMLNNQKSLYHKIRANRFKLSKIKQSKNNNKSHSYIHKSSPNKNFQMLSQRKYKV
jgi:hypothetical protein